MSGQAVDLAGIAELLNISKETAWRKARTGEIPGFQLTKGGKWGFFPDEVIAHITRKQDPWVRSPRSRAARRRSA